MPARIVVVHNDADFLACMTGALSQRGDNVSGFGDAGDALKALEAAKSVDVLVTGIGLDGLQGIGLSLARVSRTARPEVKVPFIARPMSTAHQRHRGIPAGTREDQCRGCRRRADATI